MLTMDLGVGASLVRFTAELRAQGRLDQLSRLIATAQLFYLGLTAVFAAAALLWGDAALRALRIPPGISEARQVLLLCTLAGGATALASVQNGVLTGFQRLDLVNLVSVAALVPSGLGIWLALRAGADLRGVVWVQTGVALLTAVTGSFLVYRTEPRLPRRLFGWHPQVAAPLLRFGLWMQSATLINLFQGQVDKLFLSRWAGVATVTSYELGYRVSNGLFALPGLAFGAATPAAAEFAARGDRGRLAALHVRGMRWIAALALPLMASTWAAAPWLLRGWLGHVPEGAELGVDLLAASFAVNVLTGTGTSILTGEGRIRLWVYVQGSALLLHLALSVWWIPGWGLAGGLWAQMLSNAAWMAGFTVLFHRARGWPLGSCLVRPVARPALVAAVLGGGWWLLRSHLPAAASLGRLPALAAGVGALGAGTALGLAVLTAAGQFEPADFEVARNVWNQVFRGRPGNP